MTGVLVLALVIAALTWFGVWLDARWSAPSDYVAIGHRGRGEVGE